MLAGDAFKGKSQSYKQHTVHKTILSRMFCQGKGGQFALNKHPETMDMALVYVKQHIKTRHQMQLQSLEDEQAIVSPTKEQNIAQSQSPTKKSPMCDSFKSKAAPKSSVTKLQ